MLFLNGSFEDFESENPLTTMPHSDIPSDLTSLPGDVIDQTNALSPVFESDTAIAPPPVSTEPIETPAPPLDSVPPDSIPPEIGGPIEAPLLPVVSIAPVHSIQREGDAGVTVHSFTASLSSAISAPVTVFFRTQRSGSAIDKTTPGGSDPSDGAIRSPSDGDLNSITFNPGDALTRTIEIPVVGDTIFEPDETLVVTLTQATGATLGVNSATTTIANDDNLPAIFINDVVVLEGDSGTTNAAMTLRLSNTTNQTVTIRYSLTGTTATPDVDFVGVSEGTVTFAPGQTVQTLNVVLNGDRVAEQDETIRVNLFSPVNTSIGDNLAFVSIVNDDPLPIVSISPATLSQLEGSSGTTAYVFTVSLSNPSAAPVRVNYSTNNGTATLDNGDYRDNDGVLVFSPNGPLSQTITVLVNGDRTDEDSETLTVMLTGVAGGTLGVTTATATLLNDDQTLSISDVTVTESDRGTIDGTFIINLSRPSSQTVTVNYSTADGSATAGSDYAGASSVPVTFQPGETSKSIIIPINGDFTNEPDETFSVNLSDAVNATIEDGRGVATIRNNDPVPSLRVEDIRVTEGDRGTTSATLTLNLSNPSSTPIAVTYRTENGSADEGDYQAIAETTLTFEPEQTRQTITVSINGDAIEEEDETFSVRFSDPVNATLEDTTAVVAIVNDDLLSINLGDLGGNKGLPPNEVRGFRIDGGNPEDRIGASVVGGGDFNSDGIDDVILGAPGSDPSRRNNAGSAYVIWGRNSDFSSVDLSSLDAATGFRINGARQGDSAGVAVAMVGDLNNDGIDDLTLGSHTADPGGRSNAGQVHVVYGRSAPAAAVDLSSLNASSGSAINGITAQDESGIAIASIGDVNNDGRADFAIGAHNADPNGRSNAGQAYVIFGQSSNLPNSLNLSGLNGRNGFRINGEVAGDNAGRSVHAAGDLNGDGVDDLAISAINADPRGSNSGAVYVIWGQAGLGSSGSLDLSALNGSNGVQINGISTNDRAGFAISSVGDLNNDGIDDLAIGAPNVDANGSDAGQVYVVFGSRSGFAATLDLSALDGSNGFRINGAAANDLTGSSVTSVGDFNEDGIDDLAIGAPNADPSGLNNAGTVYVVYGRDRFTATLNLNSLFGGVRITGAAANDLAGAAISGVGDMNQDGATDLIIGAPGFNGRGAGFVVFGVPAKD